MTDPLGNPPPSPLSSRPERTRVTDPLGNPPPSPLSSRPERTRISCHAAQDTTACVAFIKESRMKFASATNFYRKSGVA